jgi:hypothetical protein
VRRLARNWPPHNQDPQLSAFLGDDEYTYVVRHRPELISTAIQRLAAAYPTMREYNQRQRDATAEDMAHIVDFLAAALYVHETAVFTDFIAWTEGVLHARGVPPVALRVGLETIQSQLRDYPAASAILASGAALIPA